MCFERFFIFLSYFLGISVRILGNLDRFERFFKIWMILFFLKNVYFNGVWTFLGWFLNEILMLRFFENFKRSLSDFFLTAPFWFFGCFSFFHIWISLIFSLFSGFFFFLRFFSDERLFFYYVCQITSLPAEISPFWSWFWSLKSSGFTWSFKNPSSSG